ncbi:MAG TPA: hypothetical protein VK644_00630 [Chitinophagaceae bacterium]|nr:hypothetical protein [Chitinophagaceae bacterium]
MGKIAFLRSSLRRYPLFLLTIPFVFLVHTANQYFGLLHWKYIVTDLLLYLTVPILIYFLLAMAWRSYRKSGIVLFVSLVIFYFFHVLYDGLKISASFSFLGRYSIWVPLIAGGMIVLIIYLFRSRKSFDRFYFVANTLFLLLLAGGLVQYAQLSLTGGLHKQDQADPEKKLQEAYRRCDTCSNPDIYFLLFDEYTNSKTLATEFGYENSFIENRLGARGFHIPHASRSNYNFTHMALGSELNLSYLANLGSDRHFYTKDFLRAYYTVFNNEFAGILKKQGYSIRNYSIFDMAGSPVLTTAFLTELTWRSVIGQTFFHKLRRDIGWQLNKITGGNKTVPQEFITKSEHDMERIKKSFDGVVAEAKAKSSAPRFIYAHFLVPHETYYFDSLGKRLDMMHTAEGKASKEDYLAQLIYANRFIMAPLVDSIFENARRPFVIVIQGDHGYRFWPAAKVDLEFENFSAIYFPNGNYDTIGDSLSSVNTFRIVLNKYFHTSYPLLKDTAINLYKTNSY